MTRLLLASAVLTTAIVSAKADGSPVVYPAAAACTELVGVVDTFNSPTGGPISDFYVGIAAKHAEATGWIEGYLSAAGWREVLRGGLALKFTNTGDYKLGLITWVRNWCQEHPSQTILDAAEAYLWELQHHK
jgi:hypothetical protein